MRSAAPSADPGEDPERLPIEEDAIGDEEAARLFKPLENAEGLLLAVSGGPDSVALMRLIARWAKGAKGERRPPVHVATVDHGLRPEARREAEAVCAWADDLGVPSALLTWTGPKPATRLQEKARQARYRLLREQAQSIGASHIVLAHHADDAAETVLFRLIRGSGLGGLSGMAALQEWGGIALARPLLDIAKTRLVATCRQYGQPFFEDPSNADHRFARARLRLLLPALAAEGLDAASWRRFARRMARAEEALDQAARDAFARIGRDVEAEALSVDAAALAELPGEIGLRVLQLLVAEAARLSPPPPLMPVEVESPAGSPRLGRLERLHTRLTESIRDAKPCRATIGGMIVAFDQGRIRILREPSRKRGRRRAD